MDEDPTYTFRYRNGQSMPFWTLGALSDVDFFDRVLPEWEAKEGKKHILGTVTCAIIQRRKVPEPGTVIEHALAMPTHQQVPGYIPPEDYDSEALLAANKRLLPHSMEVAGKVIGRFSTQGAAARDGFFSHKMQCDSPEPLTPLQQRMQSGSA